MPPSAGRTTLATSNWLPFDDRSRVQVRSRAVQSRRLDAGLSTLDSLPDAAARQRAVDPAHNVVLEASAGTGKTHVLVDRYLNLLSRGVEPTNILAITFTRKAAAEMRGPHPE